MSLTDYSVPGKNFSVHQGPGQDSLVHLNEIFKVSMKNARTLLGADVIIRCESLPDLHGRQEDFIELFNTLINLIISTRMRYSKLFLHVHCAEEFLEPDKSLKHHTIRFHTNFSTTEEWKEEHSEQLAKCKELIANYGGRFMVNNISNTGCLFFIMLPGKS
jgi:hypothetical protein